MRHFGPRTIVSRSIDWLRTGSVGLLLPAFVSFVLVLASCDGPTEPTYAVEGTVMTEDGRSVPDISVRLDGGDAGVRETSTDATGGYRFDDVPRGRYGLWIEPPSGAAGEPATREVVLPGDGGRHDFLLVPIRELQLVAEPGESVDGTLGSGVRVLLRNESSDAAAALRFVDGASNDLEFVPGATFPVLITTSGPQGTSSSAWRSSQGETHGARVEIAFPVPGSGSGWEPVLRLEEDPNALAFPLKFEKIQSGPHASGGTSGIISTSIPGLALLPPGSGVIIALERFDDDCTAEGFPLEGPLNTPDSNDRFPVVLIHGWQATYTRCEQFARMDLDTYWNYYLAAVREAVDLRDDVDVYAFRYPTFLPIEDVSQILVAMVQGRGWPELALVGFSRGGLVARVAAANLTDSRVPAVITAGTPHEGATIAEDPVGNLQWLATQRSDMEPEWECGSVGGPTSHHAWCAATEVGSRSILDEQGASHMTPEAVSLLPVPGANVRRYLIGSFIGEPEEVEFTRVLGLRVYYHGYRWYWDRGILSDGMVPSTSALPGSWNANYRVLRNLDHGHLRDGYPHESERNAQLRTAIQKALRAAVHPIAVEISSPAEGATLPLGEPVPLEGSAVTIEGTVLTEGALVWRSDQDGELGTGESIGGSDLSAGNHTVTLEATDEFGAVRSASIEITVLASALTGQALDQFTSTPVPDVTVSSTKESAITDGSGQFTVRVASSDDDLVFSSSGIHTRRTFGQGSDLDWRVIPSDFNMNLFDEVARSLGDLIAVAENDRTHKWTGGSPRVFIDTRNHEDDPKYAPEDLPQEIQPHVAEYIGRWSAGTVSPEDVILTDSPPADGTEGTIVIRFVDLSDLKQEEDGETIWALARTSPYSWSWDRYEIVAGVIELDLVSSGLNMVPGLVVGREIGHIFGMGQFHEDRPFMMRAVTPPPGTEFSDFEAKVADIVYSRLPGTRSPDTEERPAAAVAPRAHEQPVGAPFLTWVSER